MPSYCCVPYCRSDAKKLKISFHQIPADTNRRLLWLKAIPRQGKSEDSPWVPGQFTTVCQKHFKRDDYRQGPRRLVLKNDAVPSIFPVCRTKLQPTAKESLVKLEPNNTAVQPSDAPESIENNENLYYDRSPSSSSASSTAIDSQLSDTHGTGLSENQNRQIISRILSDAFSNCTDIEL